MIAAHSRAPDAASPWMLFVSVCLHGIFILAALWLSVSLRQQAKPQEELVSHVKLVETAGISGPELQKMEQEPAGMPDRFGPQPSIEIAKPDRDTEQPRELVTARAMAPPSKESVVRLKKRKRPLKQVEAPKPAPENKKETPPEKKKEDPKSFLEKRLAAIKKEVENRKADPAAGTQGASSDKAGNRPGGGLSNEELLHWLDGLRKRINSNWSVFGDKRQVEKVTVVAVKIADDGHLVSAAIEESSGDDVFDRSAMRAVHQASPFPPVPPDVRERIRKAGGLALRFTPGGMQ